MPRHTITKLLKTKEKKMKSAREKQHITYRGPPISLKAEFSFGNLKLRTKWYNISKCRK